MPPSSRLVVTLTGALLWGCANDVPSLQLQARASATTQVSSTPRVNASAPAPLAARIGAKGEDCTAVGDPLQERVASRLRERFYRTADHSKVEVSFPCDGLGARIDRVWFARGSGHGFSLEVYGLVRRGNGFDVHGVQLRERKGSHGSNKRTLQLRLGRGHVAAEQVDEQLLVARTARSAQLREVLASNALGLRGTSGSSDIYLAISLFDKRASAAREFAGYVSSASQEHTLPLVLSNEALSVVLDQLAFRDSGDTDVEEGHRAAFEGARAGSKRHFGEGDYWWVTERYQLMAQRLRSSSKRPSR